MELTDFLVIVLFLYILSAFVRMIIEGYLAGSIIFGIALYFIRQYMMSHGITIIKVIG